MRSTRAKRKLLLPATLHAISEKAALEVPLNKQIKHLDVSRPVVVKLLRWYASDNPIVRASILPPWLDADGPQVQENPDDWYYEGFFPFGEWKQCKQ